MLNEYGAMLPKAPDAYFDFFEKQHAWIRTNIENRANFEAPQYRYWQAQHLLDEQFNGLVAGYNRFINPPAMPLTHLQLYLMQSAGDLYEINAKVTLSIFMYARALSLSLSYVRLLHSSM